MTGRNTDRGYTLIEVMAVLVLIGLLAAINLGTYLALRDRAKYAEIKLALNAIYKEASLYKDEHGEYPPDANPGGSANC